jgi:hypothetical protein
MPLSNIVTVVLRLFAIQMVGQSINMALSFAAADAKQRFHPPHYWLAYLVPVAGLVFALLEWCLAPVIARLVTRNRDAEVALGMLSRLDLYSFAFVFLGLYFILTSIAPALDWLHYYLGISAVGSQSESQSSFYTLASYLVTLTAGLVALLAARRWARKLLARERREETVQPNDAASML